MPAGGICQEIIVSFLQAPFAQVMQIVRFALADRYDGEPAAAFAATAAGTGDWRVLLGFHAYTGCTAIGVRVTEDKMHCISIRSGRRVSRFGTVPEISVEREPDTPRSESADILQQVPGIRTESRVRSLILRELPESPQSPGAPDRDKRDCSLFTDNHLLVPVL